VWTSTAKGTIPEPTPDPDITSKIVVAGGTHTDPGRTDMGENPGKAGAAYLFPPKEMTDDNEGQRMFKFEKVGQQEYHIILAGQAAGGGRYLTSHYDKIEFTEGGKSASKWRIYRGNEAADYYNIEAVGGAYFSQTMLSCNQQGNNVNLWTHDDGSGRQRWKMSDFPYEVPVDTRRRRRRYG
jgi:hypothetical protein